MSIKETEEGIMVTENEERRDELSMKCFLWDGGSVYVLGLAVHRTRF